MTATSSRRVSDVASQLDGDDIHALQKTAFPVDDWVIDYTNAVGSGSNSSVHYARRHTDDTSQPLALAFKILKLRNEESSPDLDIAVLRSEVVILASIPPHPSIIGFHGVCLMPPIADHPQRWGLQMEYCGGGNLAAAVRRTRFQEEKARDVMVDVFSGLAHLHKRGCIHRDIKPENILMTLEGRVKISDFGLACRLTDSEAMERRCGSPGYIAPEMCRGHKCDIKVDTFSAGGLLYFLISGKGAFTGSNVQSVMKRTINHPVNFRRSVCLERLSDSCKAFIKTLMEKDPQNRPTASEALDVLWIAPAVETPLSGVFSPRSTNNSCRGSMSSDYSSDAATTSRDTPSGMSFSGMSFSGMSFTDTDCVSKMRAYWPVPFAEADEESVMMEFEPRCPKPSKPIGEKPSGASPLQRRFPFQRPKQDSEVVAEHDEQSDDIRF